MHRIRPLVMVFALALAGTAGGQTLTFDPDIGAAPEGPARGASMEQVEARYGVPRSRTGPVGDPPITVWHYDGFKVYFEHRRVLHATARKSRPAPGG